MDEAKSQFDATFSHWAISLPHDAPAQRKRGKIVEAGWAIWYLFGSDERGEYLDYYASHRMTDDRHVRIYASGESERLASIQSMRMVSRNPQEDARLKAEHLAENQRVANMLTEKGFLLDGDDPGGIRVNRFLRLGGMED